MRATLLLLLFAALAWAEDKDTELEWQDRVEQFRYRTFSLQRFAWLGVDSAVDHLLADPHDWGRGADGYGMRFGSGFGRRLIRNSVELVAGAALHEDIRFRYSGGGTLGYRLKSAALQTVLTTGHGQRHIAWSRLAATGAGVAATTYWKPGPMTGSTLLWGLGDGFLGHFENSLLTEFSPDLKRFGMRVWRPVKRQGSRMFGSRDH